MWSIATLGMTGFIGLQFTTLSVSAMTIIITLAVADSVHILMTVVQEMRQGKDLVNSEVEKYTYTYLGKEGAMEMVERIPTDPKSGYSRQIVWHDTAKNLRATKIESGKNLIIRL